jgi:hypothetical protein
MEDREDLSKRKGLVSELSGRWIDGKAIQHKLRSGDWFPSVASVSFPVGVGLRLSGPSRLKRSSLHNQTDEGSDLTLVRWHTFDTSGVRRTIKVACALKPFGAFPELIALLVIFDCALNIERLNTSVRARRVTASDLTIFR